MDHEFQMPDGGSFKVRGWGNLPIELIAALAGVKPAIHVWVQEQDMGYLKELCARFGFASKEFSRSKGEGPVRLEVVIGKERTAVERCAKQWYDPQSNPGRALGYPECCVRRYVDWVEETPDGKTPAVDVVRRIHANTKGRKGLPWVLNDVFYCYSRTWGPDAPDRRRRLQELNPGLDLDIMNVIPWHPCSYRCPRSLEMAQAAESLMRRVLPRHAALLKACLARPVLFWDWDRYAVLDGECDAEDSCRYVGLKPPFAGVKEEHRKLLLAGDRVTKRKGAFEVLKGTKTIGAFKDDAPILLDFGG